MDPVVFNSMGLDQKEALLKLDGRLIDLRYEPKFTVYLYQAFGIMIEAYYHKRAGLITAEAVCDTRLDLYNPPPSGSTGLRALLKYFGLAI